MALVTLETLKRKLSWPGISLLPCSETLLDREHHFNIFRVNPSQPDFPPIDLHFDQTIMLLLVLRFGRWASRFERSSDDRRNIVDAIRIARELISGDLCVVEQCGASGEYLGGSAIHPSAIPSIISKRAQYFRRIAFNQPAMSQPIPFERYWEGEDIRVEWNNKVRTEEIWKQHGLPSQW